MALACTAGGAVSVVTTVAVTIVLMFFVAGLMVYYLASINRATEEARAAADSAAAAAISPPTAWPIDDPSPLVRIALATADASPEMADAVREALTPRYGEWRRFDQWLAPLKDALGPALDDWRD